MSFFVLCVALSSISEEVDFAHSALETIPTLCGVVAKSHADPY
jgi:hypothetical protein